MVVARVVAGPVIGAVPGVALVVATAVVVPVPYASLPGTAVVADVMVRGIVDAGATLCDGLAAVVVA